MILLIWDSFGEDSLKFYEFPDESEGAALAKACNGHYVNGSDDKDIMDKLEKLSDISRNGLSSGPGSFGPYSAIYVSGFIP